MRPRDHQAGQWQKRCPRAGSGESVGTHWGLTVAEGHQARWFQRLEQVCGGGGWGVGCRVGRRTFQAEGRVCECGLRARGVGRCGRVRAGQERLNILNDRQDLMWGLRGPGVMEGLCGVVASCVLWETLPCVLPGGG